jgi:hypothetical protein
MTNICNLLKENNKTDALISATNSILTAAASYQISPNSDKTWTPSNKNKMYFSNKNILFSLVFNNY